MTDRQRPKFVESITQLRHASTVIRRLGSQSGLRTLPPESDSNADERTVMRGFDASDAAEQTDQTDPSLTAATKLPAGLPASVSRPAPVAPSFDLDRQPPAMAVPLASLSAVAPPPVAERTDEKHGEIIVVFGCRGGAGATTIAVNLAAELARTPRGAVVVDLDLQMGDVLCSLDLGPNATIAELLAEIDVLDEASLRRRLAAHGSGLFALSQGDRFDQLEQLRPDRIPALIAGLSRQFGTVVIDGLRDFSDLSIAALDMADRIILVVPEDVAGVKNASRSLAVFRRLGYGNAKLALVVNRHEGKNRVSPAAISATLKIEPLAVLANDPAAAQTALDTGVPLTQSAPKSRLRQSISGLAAALRGATAAAADAGGIGGLLRALFGGKR